MKNPFLKRLMKEGKEDVIHSSSYAKAQNADGIGTASTESFSERMKIDRNRSVVRRYGESRVVNDMQGAKKMDINTYNKAEDKAFGSRDRGEAKKQTFGPRLDSNRVKSGGVETRTVNSSVRSNPGIARKNPGIFR